MISGDGVDALRCTCTDRDNGNRENAIGPEIKYPCANLQEHGRNSGGKTSAGIRGE